MDQHLFTLSTIPVLPTPNLPKNQKVGETGIHRLNNKLGGVHLLEYFGRKQRVPVSACIDIQINIALSVLIDKPNINICTHLSELGNDYNVVKHAVL